MTRDLPMLLSQPKVETDDVDDIELKHEDTRSTSCSSGDYDDDDEGDSEQGLFNVNGGGGGGEERIATPRRTIPAGGRDDDNDKRQRRRRRRQERMAQEKLTEALHKRRRVVLIAASLLPFLMASVALVAMATTRDVNSDGDDGGRSSAIALAGEDATSLKGMSSDVPTTMTIVPTAPIAAPADEPSPAPMPAATETAHSYSDGGGGGGGLRSTPAPAVATSSGRWSYPNVDTTMYRGDEPTVPPTTRRPTTEPPTKSPTASPSTARPTSCLPGGHACPRDRRDCCAGICVRDDGSGERVCGTAREEVVVWGCVESGGACPDRKEMRGCCSGWCSGGQGKVCV
eukprot:CAMPEP_0181137696 /NCGR_PEP_ID=MMETSP1071-20121207/33841_1 /TAXON_ID=35127 /ORGANISM="Thalassiosira sp., Strain NH16" /LENGTH=342 /DNA_ID=CAMNT_0023224463 /DNA_START=273 /DNA_END=1301 /DNA_ORIENTATION=-